MFTQNRIDAFLEYGETEEIKNDKSFNAFRYCAIYIAYFIKLNK